MHVELLGYICYAARFALRFELQLSTVRGMHPMD
jgi:hypothetical protein